MSQHDFEITTADANTGITFRAQVNAALQALASNNSGIGDPAIMYPYEFKFNTAESPVGFYVRKGDNTAWVKAGYVDASGQLIMLNADNATALKGVIYINNGNVGIGTTAPGAKLDIVNGNQEIQFLTGSNSTGYMLQIGVNDDGVNFSNNSTIRGYNFKNANGTLMTILSNGNVGIGTAAPSYRLHVNGTTYSSGGYVSSDSRYKQKVSNIVNAIEKLSQLDPMKFIWKTVEYPDKSFPEGEHYGLIAQEVENIFPEVVNTDGQGYKAISYIELIPVLIAAIKEQQVKIELQQLKINELENRIITMESRFR